MAGGPLFSPESYTLPGVVSILLHGLLVVFVLWGWESQPEPRQRVTPNFIEAKLVTLQPEAPPEPKAKPQPKVIDVQAQRREQERQAAEAERQRQAAAKRKAEADAKAKAEAEKKRKAEEQRKQEEARQEAERQEAERREQERQEQERRRQEEQRRQEAAMADALAAEQAELQAIESEATAQSYTAQMAQRIEQNWSRPPSARMGMTCELQIQLIPTGEVINVTVVRSSGNAAFDRSAESAVRKVGKFDSLRDVPPEIFEQYFRQVTLVFNPRDLRQ